MKRFSSQPSALALFLAAFALAVCVVTMGAAAIKAWPSGLALGQAGLALGQATRSVAEERNIIGDGCLAVPRTPLAPNGEDSLNVEAICEIPKR